MSAQAIWKFYLPLGDRVEIQMPECARILTVQVQRGDPVIWALVDRDVPTSPRRFRIVGTGHPVDFMGDYIGTFQMPAGYLVFHVFEVTSFPPAPASVDGGGK